MPNSAERSEPVTATIMLILLFAGFGLLAWALSSCSTSKDVYQLKGDKWTAGPNKSSVTGWTYTK
jgi:hypothetical protein